jgi:hypothetical protein
MTVDKSWFFYPSSPQPHATQHHYQVEISEIKTLHDVDFLKINAQPIKQAISTWLTKWLYLYTQYLQNYVGDRLIDLHNLLHEVNTGEDYLKLLMGAVGFISVDELCTGSYLMRDSCYGRLFFFFLLRHSPFCSPFCIMLPLCF